MSSYGKYKPGERAWPVTDFSKDKGKTVQADRESADINVIVARLLKSGAPLPSFNGEPFYGDVSELGGLADSLIKVQHANELFMEFPAEVRERFDNDKVKLVDFLADPKNLEEAVSLGLVQRKPVPEPAPVPVPAPPAPGPAK